MRRLSTIAALAAALAACAHAPPSRKTRETPCGLQIDGVAAVLKPGTTIVLGEMHGSREVPRFAAALACLAAEHAPVAIGLEMPDEALSGDGAWWRDPFQDGRRSVAMRALLDEARAQRGAGKRVEVFAIDNKPPAGVKRDHAMAERVLAARAAHPDSILVLVVGNLHARRLPGVPWDPNDKQAWLGTFLPPAPSTITLDSRYPQGTSWICRGQECGPTLTNDNGGGSRAAIRIGPTPDRAYDGVFDLGSLTASPPAAYPDKAVGLDEKLQALLASPAAKTARIMGEAQRAYERGDFVGCVRAMTTIASPTAEQLYNRACCHARAGDQEGAFESLNAALKRGLNPQALESDADLASLRSDPRFPKP